MPIELPAHGRELLLVQGNAIGHRQSTRSGITPDTMRGQVRGGRWHGVERPHALPAAQRQARISHRTGSWYLDNLYEYGLCVELDGTAPIPPTSSGETSGGTPRTRCGASSRSGSASSICATAGARRPTPSPPCWLVTAGPPRLPPAATPPAPPSGTNSKGLIMPPGWGRGGLGSGDLWGRRGSAARGRRRCRLRGAEPR